jgi:uncharacterized protein (DUF1697 family)
MEYIILLRGINVGGRTIPMAELKACFEKAGYRKVRTVLQTGNVILDSPEKKAATLRARVESLLSKTFGYPARVLVLAPETLRALAEKYPFTGVGSEFHRYIVFTEDGFEKELVKLAGTLDKSMEEIKAGKDVLYWRVRKGSTLDSDFGKLMGKAAAKHFMTNRNLNTLEKVLAKCEPA